MPDSLNLAKDGHELSTQGVIFDLDDTLVESVKVKWAHHKAVALRHYDIELTDNDIAPHWGKPLDTLIAELYRRSDTAEAMMAANRALEPEFHKTVFNGSHKLIQTLKARGVEVGIVTSTFHQFAIDDLTRLGFAVEDFCLIQGADDWAAHKPDPAVFAPALQQLSQYGISADEVAYVGDSLLDAAAAQSAGLRFIGVTTGLVSEAEMRNAGVTEVAGCISEVLELL